MRLLSVKNALLVTAFLGSLPQLSLGVPIARTAETTDLQVVPRGDSFSLVPVEQLDETNIIPRDEDEFSLKQTEDANYIDIRAFRPPRPDPPPPPPAPRPRPNPGAPGAPRPRPPPRPVTPPRPDPPSPKPDWEPIPDDVNPGQGSGTGDDAKAMDTYEAGGQKQMNDYENIIKSGQDDTPIVDTVDDLAKYGKNKAFLDIRKNDQYQVVDTDVMVSDSLKELKNFQSGELGFDIKNTGFLRQTVVNKADGGAGQMINRGTYDKGGQFIVYQDAFKEANTITGPKKTPLNEMGTQNFIAAAGDNTGKFKAAFLTDIQNKEFWAITRQNYNDMKQPFDQVLTFKSGTPQFDRYMGSPNFGSKFFSFGNHHNAMGDGIPDKVIVIPKDVENSGNKLTVGVVFKDASA